MAHITQHCETPTPSWHWNQQKKQTTKTAGAYRNRSLRGSSQVSVLRLGLFRKQHLHSVGGRNRITQESLLDDERVQRLDRLSRLVGLVCLSISSSLLSSSAEVSLFISKRHNDIVAVNTSQLFVLPDTLARGEDPMRFCCTWPSHTRAGDQVGQVLQQDHILLQRWHHKKSQKPKANFGSPCLANSK